MFSGMTAVLPAFPSWTNARSVMDPESPLGETAAEKEFLDQFVANEKQVPWLIYSKQPDCVYFSHIAHVKMGEIGCTTCHGDFANNETPLYIENRLTGYSIDIWGKNIRLITGTKRMRIG